MKFRLLVTAVVVTALSPALLIPTGASATTAPNYIAVIDAGSSGTRLTLFADKEGSLIPEAITEAKTKTKGLSSFVSSPANAGPEAIAPLLAQLSEYLTQQGIAKTDVPVAMLATAGMRNVRLEDRDASQSILASTAATIAASGHPTAANRILPAVQEASLAWLDANVLGNTLNKKKGGIGIVEIGGASAQVGFRSSKPTGPYGPGVQQVRVAGMSIPVVAVSYLGLGGNDARSKMQTTNNGGAFCFPNNSSGQAPSVFVPTSLRPVNSSTAQYSWNRCASAYNQTVAVVGGKRTASASVAPIDLRKLPGFDSATFIGLGSIPYTFSDLGIENKTNERVSLRQSTTQLCTGTNAWEKVLAAYGEKSNTFADTLCSTGTYTHEFIFGSSGVGVSTQRFTTSDSRLSRAPAWTSGYAITVLDP